MQDDIINLKNMDEIEKEDGIMNHLLWTGGLMARGELLIFANFLGGDFTFHLIICLKGQKCKTYN